MNRIKLLRTEARMRQLDLAQKLKIGQSTLSGWENGQYEIDNENLNKLADLFDCSIDYLLGRTDVRDFKKLDSVTIPEEFTNPEEAREYIGMHTIFGSDGFRADLMSDEDILDFANEMLRQAKLISYKYKK